MADSPAEDGNVFISSSHKNKKYLDEFCEHLAAQVPVRPIPIWIDREQIKPGDKWHQEIMQGLEKAQVAVLLVSRPYLASEYVRPCRTAQIAREGRT